MKKLIYTIIIAIMLFSLTGIVFASEQMQLQKDTTSEIIEMKEKSEGEIKEYTKKYGSESYGKTAYIISKVRIYSIPFCFIGIAIGAIYQYALGTRRLDMKHKGFNLIITFVTLLVICQVLPLIYTVVVLGWRG